MQRAAGPTRGHAGDLPAVLAAAVPDLPGWRLAIAPVVGGTAWEYTISYRDDANGRRASAATILTPAERTGRGVGPHDWEAQMVRRLVAAVAALALPNFGKGDDP